LQKNQRCFLLLVTHSGSNCVKFFGCQLLRKKIWLVATAGSVPAIIALPAPVLSPVLTGVIVVVVWLPPPPPELTAGIFYTIGTTKK